MRTHLVAVIGLVLFAPMSYHAALAQPSAPVLESALHQPLPEQYLSVDAEDPWKLQRSFLVDSLPPEATLYIAAPARGSGAENIQVFINDKLAGAKTNVDDAIKPLLLVQDVTAYLKRGQNQVMVEANGAADVAVKIVSAPVGVDAPSLLLSGDGWTANGPITLHGSIESYPNLLGNDDAAMYQWPGYDGISSYLTRQEVQPARILPSTGAQSVVLDFGREYAGRLHIFSQAAQPLRVAFAYGESLEEAQQHPYLGTNSVDVPPSADAYGPKSAFRYVVVSLPQDVSPDAVHFTIDAISYPVTYFGSFDSSDQSLNQIWEVGAYTAHLCMQDTIWDAPKRDRDNWAGDLNVSGLVIDDVFADRFLMRKTLDVLIADAGDPPTQDVNDIPGYSAFWIMNLADYYRHTDDRDYLQSTHDELLNLLTYMRGELDSDGLFANTRKAWTFVDWSPKLDGDTTEARRATSLEFVKAFSDAAWLLNEQGDATNAQRYEALAANMRDAARARLYDAATASYGTRWQSNAFAIYSGVATPAQTAQIWNKVLSKPSRSPITPYYAYYVITAMARANHRRDAIRFIRRYWGGMIHEGATSFWEAYDPSWPKGDFHRYLQADNGEGYYVSLSHGWSSGPTAWMMSEILGIHAKSAGFDHTLIRPDLAGLSWARGSEATPHGTLAVSYRAGHRFSAQIDLPPGIDAEVSMPVQTPRSVVTVNGRPATTTPDENGRRRIVLLQLPGKYSLSS